MIYREFIKKIINKIKEKKYTLKKIANYSGIDVSYLSRIISGKRNPPYDEEVIRKIAKILDLDEDELIFAAGRIPRKYQHYFSHKNDIDTILQMLKYKNYKNINKQIQQQKVSKNFKEISPTPEELL